MSVKIWAYMIVFSVMILSFLWLFQVAFLNTYYEWSKTREIKSVALSVLNSYQANDYETLLDEIAYNSEVCIEITNQYNSIYSSNMFNRGCIMGEGLGYTTNYKIDFIDSGENHKSYKLINPRFDNESLIYAMKLGSGIYAFISTSLVPMDSTTHILTSQLIIVTFFVLLLSLLVAYFISKRLSRPIVKINEAAKKMAKGEYDVVFETGEDIAEMNELAATLNYARNELAKTEDLRRDLLANVSHDLKTPLTMIKAYAEMARDLNSDNKEKREQNLNVITEEADRLNLLVNDILDLSKLQANTIELHMEVFDVTELIHMILSHYQYLVETEDFHFIFDDTVHYKVRADKKRIEQVIYNLINNAINYTGTNKTITIELTEQQHTILVEVKDSGKGINSKDIDLIWDKYYKVDKKYQRNQYGTGLGLSIVKNILMQHQVHYGVRSKKGKGTVFYFELDKADKRLAKKK